MDKLPGAISLSRALLTLFRNRQTGILEIRANRIFVRISIVFGTPRAIDSIPGEDDTIGDALYRAGELDVQTHHHALSEGEPKHPVGNWLVNVGAASRPALEYTLRNQLRSRIYGLICWPDLEYRFVAGSADIGIPLLQEPIIVADIILGILKEAVADIPLQEIRNRVGMERLAITTLGRLVLEQAALWPDEAAMSSLLERGSDILEIMETTGNSERALRTLGALLYFRAVRTEKKRKMDYTLLLRKQRQLRNRANSFALLDIPQGASPAEAHRALHRLAKKLHPDSFGQEASPALTKASHEVMSALISAENKLRRLQAV